MTKKKPKIATAIEIPRIPRTDAVAKAATAEADGKNSRKEKFYG